ADRRRRAEHVARVRVVTVERLAEQPERDLRRVVALRGLVVEQLALLARELVGGQPGIEDAVGEQLEPGMPRLRQPLRREPEAVAAGDAAERAAEPVDAIGHRR